MKLPDKFDVSGSSVRVRGGVDVSGSSVDVSGSLVTIRGRVDVSGSSVKIDEPIGTTNMMGSILGQVTPVDVNIKQIDGKPFRLMDVDSFSPSLPVHVKQ